MRSGRGDARCVSAEHRRAGGLVVFGVLCALAGALVLTAPALAVFQPHPLLGSFGPEGPHSLTSFSDVEGVAVNQATGDVYVYDNGGNGSVYRFDAAGKPVNFTETGGNVHGNVIENVGHAAYSAVQELALDNSSATTKGDLYVDDYSGVKIYDSETGGELGELNGAAGGPWGTPCGVAVDAGGHVYVGLESGDVNMYTPAGGVAANTDYTSSLWGLGYESCNLAAGPDEELYVTRWKEGPVTEYSTSEPDFNTVEAPPVFSVEVDAAGSTVAADSSPSSHIVYVDEQNLIAEYETSATPTRLSTIGQAEPGKLSGESFGVASNAAGGIYASSGGGRINIYAPVHPSAPSIDEEYASDVTEAAATLHTQVNPALADTHYYFQWGTESCVEHAAACTDVPAAPGADIGAGESDVTASTELRSLTPGTLYHYRVIASNRLGTMEGPEHTFTTFAAGAPLTLPDNRAWEQVSPVAKNGAHIVGLFGSEEQLGSVAPMQASPEGNSVAYVAIGAFGEAKGASRGSNYLATRGSDGWSTRDITPPMLSQSYGNVGHDTPYKAFSLDLSRGLLLNGDSRPVENPPLGVGAPPGYQDLYLRAFADESYQSLLTSTPAEEPEHFLMELEGVTPNLKRVVFASDEALTAGAVDTGAPNLYMWSENESELQQVNILPHGEAAPGATVGSGQFEGQAVFEEGPHERVIWSTKEALYLYETGRPTVELDASDIGGESGGGTFLTASGDGSLVFFRDGLRLTSDSTAHGGATKNGVGEDIYVYNIHTGGLTDITVDPNANDPEGAAVEGVLGANADGSSVYFVARGSLAGSAVTGANNLYAWHEGVTTFVGALAAADEEQLEGNAARPGLAYDWAGSIARRTARVASHGESAVFMSAANLTGYDNTDLSTGKPDEEVYLYDAAQDRLSCISCNPSGARPTGPSDIAAGTHFESFLEGKSLYQPRVLSGGGNRVFFETYDALVPQDTNGQLDVYEYEAPGSGSCTSSSETFSERSGGCVSLISGGESDEESSFVDASANGSNVFFTTSQPLVPQDKDTLPDLYDAREDGGFPVAPQLECTGTGCQGSPAAPPTFATPPSATFAGAGNFAPPSLEPPKVKPKVLTRAQKLAAMLRTCKKKPRRARISCEATAKRRYGPPRKAKPKAAARRASSERGAGR